MNRTVVIAEAGVNHNGDLNKAKELVKVAAASGADFVKFQTFKADKIVSTKALKADYQRRNMGGEDDDSQYTMLKKLEMNEDWHKELLELSETLGISFLSTGFDQESIDFLETLHLQLYKIPSGEITNKPYLKHIAGKGKDVILSTGMATMDEIRAAVGVLEEGGLARSMITVLHCNTEYPTPMEDVNLLAMLQIKKELDIEIGYSDHTLGIEVPIAAVALGARVIEKHFTLDRNLPGPDHRASLEPDELKSMVKAIRNIELATSGDGVKRPSASERKNIGIARKSIHLQSAVKQGERITAKHLIALRPGDGLSPMLWDTIIGKKATRNLEEFHKLTLDDFC